MSKHTPGPWKVEPGVVQRTIEISANPGHKVYVARAVVCDLANAEANARLIAASPEMLQMLIRLRDMAVHPEALELIQADAARLIAKAEGRSDED